jgi:hypothetical protein
LFLAPSVGVKRLLSLFRSSSGKRQREAPQLTCPTHKSLVGLLRRLIAYLVQEFL